MTGTHSWARLSTALVATMQVVLAVVWSTSSCFPFFSTTDYLVLQYLGYLRPKDMLSLFCRHILQQSNAGVGNGGTKLYSV
jgi:hypothetical protein